MNALNTGSLPVVDTSAADKRWRQRCDREDRNANGGTSSDEKKMANHNFKPNPNVKRRTYIPKIGKTFVGLTIIEWQDGSITVKPEKSAPPNSDQGYNAEQNHELLQLALEHLKAKSSQKTTDQAALSKALRELDRLEKSSKPTGTRLYGIGNGLLKMSVKKTTEQVPVKEIKAAPQQKPATPQPEKPRTRWGVMPTLADIAARNAGTRHQAPARPFVPIDAKAPRASVQQQQEYNLQLARQKEAARNKH
jgi:hypothetical protein